jgi:hypothetical protein
MTSMQIITLVTAIVGAICGICGAVLGVINTWSQFSRNRVRLRVIPKVAFIVDGGKMVGAKATNQLKHFMASRTPFQWCIEVINLSTFAVTISEVGFARSNGLRHILIPAEVSDGKSWPTRLESRESVMLYAQIGEAPDLQITQRPCAYAETDCERIVFGSSPIFRAYANALRSQNDGGIQL